MRRREEKLRKGQKTHVGLGLGHPVQLASWSPFHIGLCCEVWRAPCNGGGGGPEEEAAGDEDAQAHLHLAPESRAEMTLQSVPLGGNQWLGTAKAQLVRQKALTTGQHLSLF